MTHVFGPVPSRRLGLSLGIDLIPYKTCTYDCLYCQVGRTTLKSMDPRPFTSVKEVLTELQTRLREVTPDVITISGSGEPTLHSEVDRVISGIKALSSVKTVIITNGSLLWNEEVRRRCLGADVIMPTLSTACDKTFGIIHRPHSGLDLSVIIRGLKTLREEYGGNLFLEVFLLAGINDTEKEVEALNRVIREIAPDKVQLNTVARPPAEPEALSLDRKRLEEIKSYLGEKAEIIAGTAGRKGEGPRGTYAELVLEMASRRPVRSLDVSDALNIRPEEARALAEGLVLEGSLRSQEHLGETYYMK